MAEAINMTAQPREATNRAAARATRTKALIPGIVYGDSETPQPIAVERKAVEQELAKPGFFIRPVMLDIGGKKHHVLPRDVQYHPVTDAPIHIDFMRLSPDRDIRVAVPVTFVNESESPGIKRGGVLNVVRHVIEVRCRADKIPEAFEVDLAGLNIGGSIHSSRLKTPEGVRLVIGERDFTICTIAAPTVVAEEAAAAAAAATAAAAAAAAAPTGEAAAAAGAAPAAAPGAAAGGAPAAAGAAAGKPGAAAPKGAPKQPEKK